MKSLTMRILAVALLVFFAVAVVAQSTNDYLDIYQVQVKPDKRAEFDAIAKKIADANRKNSGDQWEALETLYGDGNIITFISHRKDYGDIQNGMTAFNNAISKAYGANAEKIFADFSNCISWSRGEFRVRRWDLSNAPEDAAARDKIIGQTRYLRTVAVRVKAGHSDAFESLLKDIKDAHDKANDQRTIFVSQAVAGNNGTVYYITALVPSWSGFDQATSMRQMLGDDGYAKFQKVNADDVAGYSVVINRFLPELSNVSTEVASASPDFWNPKPVVAAKKPAAKSGKTEATK